MDDRSEAELKTVMQIRIGKQDKERFMAAASKCHISLTQWVLRACDTYLREFSPIDRYEDDLSRALTEELARWKKKKREVKGYQPESLRSNR